MASIRKRKAKRGYKFMAEVRRKGHPAQRKTFPTQADAKAWIRKVEASMDDGEVLSSSRHTMSWLLEQYREEHDLDNYVLGVLEWWEDRIGHKRISDLHRDDFVQGQRALMKTKKARGEGTLAPATVNRQVAMISAVLSWGMGIHSKYVTRNVARIPAVKENNKRDPYKSGWSEEKQAALLDACRDLVTGEKNKRPEPALYLLVQLALCTGARAGELLALKWPDVDLEAGTIRITKNTSRDTTKNEQFRTVPIYGEALELLRAERRKRRFDRDLVIRNSRTGKPYNYRSHWEQAKREAGLKDLRFHDLRHVAASDMAMAGETLGSVQAALGHSSPAMTNRYAHYADSAISDLAKRMAAYHEAKRGKA